MDPRSLPPLVLRGRAATEPTSSRLGTWLLRRHVTIDADGIHHRQLGHQRDLPWPNTVHVVAVDGLRRPAVAAIVSDGSAHVLGCPRDPHLVATEARARRPDGPRPTLPSTPAAADPPGHIAVVPSWGQSLVVPMFPVVVFVVGVAGAASVGVVPAVATAFVLLVLAAVGWSVLRPRLQALDATADAVVVARRRRRTVPMHHIDRFVPLRPSIRAPLPTSVGMIAGDRVVAWTPDPHHHAVVSDLVDSLNRLRSWSLAHPGQQVAGDDERFTTGVPRPPRTWAAPLALAGLALLIAWIAPLLTGPQAEADEAVVARSVAVDATVVAVDRSTASPQGLLVYDAPDGPAWTVDTLRPGEEDRSRFVALRYDPENPATRWRSDEHPWIGPRWDVLVGFTAGLLLLAAAATWIRWHPAAATRRGGPR